MGLLMSKERVLNAYEVYFRRDGEKKALIVANKSEAKDMRSKLRRNHRKFLGMRPVKLVELV